MLATIILDSFIWDERAEIAAALDDICCPDDTYGFASAGIYAFWSIPEREILYVGLAKELLRRFRQHTGLIDCDPDGCKRRQIEEYFKTHERLGYTILVQSPMEQPLVQADKDELAELFDDAFVDEVGEIVQGEKNIKSAEGFVIELHRKLGDRLPPWNKIHGSSSGRERHSLASDHATVLRMIMETVRTGRVGEIEPEGEPPYELLLNLTGEELSCLNSRATLRELAADPSICGHEENLHAARMEVIEEQRQFEDALAMFSRHLPEFRARLDWMRADGYLDRVPPVRGVPPSRKA